jgi:alpha-galactosidase
MKKALASVLPAALMLASGAAHAQKYEGLADTPQMGWNSWNKFACDISEQLIREQADAMVKNGMRDAGYTYLNIDDCWHGQRDANGTIQADPVRFPSGIKVLADYVHARGLKLGIYSDAGAKTCGGRPGSRGHEYQDARTYAAWGVDYLKYDWCETKGLNSEGAYTTMRDALRAAGRPILFSICEWGDTKPWDWAKDVGHSWRTTGDITACWDCELSHGSWSSFGVLKIMDKTAALRKYAGPGHWNDMDMLEVGNGLTPDEERAHFSIWAMMTSPLISGNDLRSMSAATLKILNNRDVIAINQDKLGVQALRRMAQGDLEMWIKPLADGGWGVLFLNRGERSVDYRHDWHKYPLADDISKHEADLTKKTFRWTDLWQGRGGDTSKALDVKLAPHSAMMLRLKAP